MKTFAFGLLAVFVAAGRGDKEEEEPVIMEDERMCVCCRLLKDMDHGLRQLCLPPTDEEAETIARLCNVDEELDDCITRLELDPNADVASINDLKVIEEQQAEREAEHDHEHEHEHEEEEMMTESGAFKSLSTIAALATAILITAF